MGSSSGLANYFINPPNSGGYSDFATDVAYTDGAVIDVRWSTDYNASTLGILQARGSFFHTIFTNESTDHHLWTIDLSDFDNVDGVNATTGVPNNIFYFFMLDANSGNGFTSHYFNVTVPSTTSSFTIPAFPTETYFSAPTLGIYVPAATNNAGNGQPYAYSSDAGQNARTNRLAFGLGLGLGIPFIIALSVLACFLVNKRDKRREREHIANGGGDFNTNPAAIAAYRTLRNAAARGIHKVGFGETSDAVTGSSGAGNAAGGPVNREATAATAAAGRTGTTGTTGQAQESVEMHQFNPPAGVSAQQQQSGGGHSVREHFAPPGPDGDDEGAGRPTPQIREHFAPSG